MTYKEIAFATTEKEADALSEYLTGLGALAITLKDAGDEPIFEPEENQTLWQSMIVTGLFPAQMSHENLLEHLLRAYPEGQLPDYTITELPDQDWEKSWMDYYEPLQFGKSLWVVPSWCEVQNPEATNVMLNPGLAFGTGTHETTALCLRWIADNPPKNLRIVDYGCGSGILAIAALKLGAKMALGIDISSQALEASRQNSQLNGILEEKFLLQDSVVNDEKYDLVIANILANPLLELSERLAGLCQGKILLSGILAHQVDSIIHQYQTWFENFQVETDGQWARIVADRGL